MREASQVSGDDLKRTVATQHKLIIARWNVGPGFARTPHILLEKLEYLDIYVNSPDF